MFRNNRLGIADAVDDNNDPVTTSNSTGVSGSELSDNDNKNDYGYEQSNNLDSVDDTKMLNLHDHGEDPIGSASF